MGVVETVKKLVGMTPEAPRPSSEFMRGNRGIVFSGWRPSLRETNDDIGAALDPATARATDIIHNSGWIAGTIEQAVADTVGTGLRLNYRPDAKALGMTPAAANEFARDVELRFKDWADNPAECDVEGKLTFGEMQASAFRHWFATGEMLAEFLWRERPGEVYGTKIRVVPTYRLAMSSNLAAGLVNGVRVDGDGRPVAYRFRRKGSADPQVLSEFEIPARDAAGRPRVLHTFVGVPGQFRGITPLVPALRVAKQFDQLADSTLMAAIIQTVFAATVSAETPTQEMLEGLLTVEEQAQIASNGGSAFDGWFQAQSGWYDNTSLDVGINGRIAHLFPGQKMDFLSAKTPGIAYKEFSTLLLREIARCVGVTYESATGDYAGVTFSSIRMATNSIFEIVKARRKFLISPMCRAGFEAWLEEDIEKGRTKLPGGLDAFVLNKRAICRSEWLGSPKPQPDDLKQSKAHETWQRLGVMSDGMIAADLGVDIEDVYAERAREKELRKTLDLPDPVVGDSAEAMKLASAPEDATQ